MFAQPKTSFSKKIIACLCALAFAASLMPVAAFAAPTQQEAAAEGSALVAQADGKLDVTSIASGRSRTTTANTTST